MNSPLHILALHAIETLPDSVSKRKELLNAVRVTLKTNHPAFSKVTEMISAIERLEELQRDLPGLFEKGSVR